MKPVAEKAINIVGAGLAGALLAVLLARGDSVSLSTTDVRTLGTPTRKAVAP